MKFNKIHFVIFVLLNTLLCFAFIRKEDLGEAILTSVIAVFVISLISFFLFWFFYYAITGGKDPSIKFHLLSQCFVTVFLLSLFGYFFYTSFYRHHDENNAGHNEYFLEPLSTEKPTLDDTLYKKGFELLEQKIDPSNNIRLTRRLKKSTSLIRINNITEPACTFYFVYTFNNHSTELASKHIVSLHYNKLVLYNKPIESLPELLALMNNNATDREESLEPGTGKKTYMKTYPPGDSSWH